MWKLLHRLHRDEAGYVLSAEAVTVGTLGVVGATVGIGAVSRSVNHELTETAYAIRSLDQSFAVPEQRGAGAWTAGSAYSQPHVDESRAELGRYLEEHGGSPLRISPSYQEPTAQADILPDEHAMLGLRQSISRTPEEREEFRRIRQRERREQRPSREQLEAPPLADAE